MNGATCKLALAAAMLFLAAGCDDGTAPIVLAAADVQPKADWSDLAFVLQDAVTENGLLIPAALSKHSDRLDRQLKLLAVTGPTVTPEQLPTEEDRIAYWYNARAAWAMKLAMVSGFPKRLTFDRLGNRRFQLDGRTMSLAQIDEILAACDDWRVLVAVPGVAFRRAPLPAEPFSGKDVRRRIAERINAFVDDGRRVVIDVEQRRVIVPPVLWRCRRRVIQAYHQKCKTRGANLLTALLPDLTGSAQRRIQDAIGYRCLPERASPLLALWQE